MAVPTPVVINIFIGDAVRDPFICQYCRSRRGAVLGNVPAVEGTEEIAEAGEADQELVLDERLEIVGAGCIQNLRRSGNTPDLDCPLEIGWRLRREKWGRGYATEAARAMANFAS